MPRTLLTLLIAVVPLAGSPLDAGAQERTRGVSLLVPPVSSHVPPGAHPAPAAVPLLGGGLAARCEAVRGDPRADAIAEALAKSPPEKAPEALTAALDSLAAAFEANPSPNRLAQRDHRLMVAAARIETLEGHERVEAAKAVHGTAEEIVSEQPDHPGAHFLLGRLNAAVMRIGAAKRLIGRVVGGGELLEAASWERARTHLEAAERGAPCVPEHHLELATLLADRGDARAAVAELGHVLALTGGESERHAVLRRRALAMMGGATDPDGR